MPLVDVCYARFQYTNIDIFFDYFLRAAHKRKKMNGKCLRCMMRCEGGVRLCLNSGGDVWDGKINLRVRRRTTKALSENRSIKHLREVWEGEKVSAVFFFFSSCHAFLIFFSEDTSGWRQYSTAAASVISLSFNQRNEGKVCSLPRFFLLLSFVASTMEQYTNWFSSRSGMGPENFCLFEWNTNILLCVFE